MRTKRKDNFSVIYLNMPKNIPFFHFSFLFLAGLLLIAAAEIAKSSATFQKRQSMPEHVEPFL